MTSSAVLRSLGDAKRAMFVTLTGAAVNTVLDAILVLKMGLGVEGAAISTALARCAIVAMGPPASDGVVSVTVGGVMSRIVTVVASVPVAPNVSVTISKIG